MENLHGLITGFHNFRREMLADDAEFFASLAKSQNPHTLVIACCDSRVDPGIILGCRPGELFVVRNVAAIVPHQAPVGQPDAVMAAIEYGVKHLEVNHIVVMGHSNCGGIHGLLHPEAVAHEDYIADWVKQAGPAVADLNDADSEHDRHRLAEEGAVLLSIDNLLSYDWIRERTEKGTLALHAVYYDIENHSLDLWNTEKEDFLPAPMLHPVE